MVDHLSHDVESVYQLELIARQTIKRSFIHIATMNNIYEEWKNFVVHLFELN